MHNLNKILIIFLLCFIWVLTSCSAKPTSDSILPTTTSVNVQTFTPTVVENKTVPPPQKESSLWAPSYIPEEIVQKISIKAGIKRSSSVEEAACTIDALKGNHVANWVYVLAAPFNTILDDVKWDEIMKKWKDNNPDFPVKKIYLDQETYDFLSAVYGEAQSEAVKILPKKQILETTWQSNDGWAIIPFDALRPEWKVISIDGNSPIHKDFSADDYPFDISTSIFCDKSVLLAPGIYDNPITNRDAQLLTTVALTGVTAMVRGTAYEMETKGVTYPGQDIKDWLRDADITHVSNEIPYWPKCPPPFYDTNSENNLVFCSNPKYNQLLQDMDANVIELTGDHFIDWGPEATIFTLDMYRQLGWKYYGGGYNIEDARKPALFEINGNKIAFLGCNAKPPGYATAKANYPGAIHCNFDDLAQQIKSVKNDGYIPIVTFQHLEYYSYSINPVLQADFQKVVDAGAVIVSGSQAHQPHGIEFYKGAFLHYGLGNLFFDQYKEGFPTRQAFIDRYVFYNGKFINAELLTMMFIDLARPRPMTIDERQDLLNTIFKVSIWPYQKN